MAVARLTPGKDTHQVPVGNPHQLQEVLLWRLPHRRAMGADGRSLLSGERHRPVRGLPFNIQGGGGVGVEYK